MFQRFLFHPSVPHGWEKQNGKINRRNSFEKNNTWWALVLERYNLSVIPMCRFEYVYQYIYIYILCRYVVRFALSTFEASFAVSTYGTIHILTFNHFLLLGCFSELSVPSCSFISAFKRIKNQYPYFKEGTTCSEGVERPARVPAHVSSVRVDVVAVDSHLRSCVDSKGDDFCSIKLYVLSNGTYH